MKRSYATALQHLSKSMDENPKRGCFTLVWNGVAFEDMSDGTGWRNRGRRKRLLKLWLVAEWLNLLGIPRDVINEIHHAIFAPFEAEMEGPDGSEYCMTYGLYTTPLEAILPIVAEERIMFFWIGHSAFSIDAKMMPRDGEEAEEDDADDDADSRRYYMITYERGKSRNSLAIHKDKYTWTLYDYMLMVSEQESFALDIGGRYDANTTVAHNGGFGCIMINR